PDPRLVPRDLSPGQVISRRSLASRPPCDGRNARDSSLSGGRESRNRSAPRFEPGRHRAGACSSGDINGGAEMSGTERDTVSVRQDMRLIGPGRMIVPLKAVWTYSRQDPYAVRASFDADAGEPVNWVFDRDLLVAALHGPAGIGDVRAWPTVEPDPAAKRPGARKKIFNIAVGPPADRAHFE